jgi:hypothetical protein
MDGGNTGCCEGAAQDMTGFVYNVLASQNYKMGLQKVRKERNPSQYYDERAHQ